MNREKNTQELRRGMSLQGLNLKGPYDILNDPNGGNNKAQSFIAR